MEKVLIFLMQMFSLKLEKGPHFSLPNGVRTAVNITMETIAGAMLFLDLLQHSSDTTTI